MPERVQVDCSAIRKLKSPELTTSASNGGISDVHTGLEGSDCITPSKRKREMADGESDSSEGNASKNYPVETCGVCFKRQRYHYTQRSFRFLYYKWLFSN